MAKHIRKRKKNIQRIVAVVVVVVLATTGYYILIASHASTPYSSTSASKGTLTGNAKSLAITGAASGNAVEFEPNATPTPTPSPTPTPVTGTGGGCTSGTQVAPCIGSSTTGASGWGTPTFNDTFANDNNTLNTKLWTPYWFSNGAAQPQNCASTVSSNTSMSGGTLNLKLTSGNACGFVTTDPDDNVSGHTGFQVTPDNGNVYVEFKATLPESSNGETANWPALWLVGQPCWPVNGEIDVMEGLSGHDGVHFQWGTCNDNVTGGGLGDITNLTGGTHTFGVLWTKTTLTGYYDGAEVWTTTFSAGGETASATAPEFLIMENSGGSFGGPSVVPSTMNVYYARVWQQ